MNAGQTDQIGGQTMGTTWSVRFAQRLPLSRVALRQSIEECLDLVIAQMSTYEDQSSISVFNQAPVGSWVPMPDEFMEVATAALHWASLSEGAFDPTVGPAVNLWGFGPDGARSEPPDLEALLAVRQRVGWARVQRRAGAVYQPGQAYLDFSGIAKGYAVDLVCRRLLSMGVQDALVEIGGELRGMGRRPGGQAWQVAVQLPGYDPQDTPLVQLVNCAVATSGDDYHAFVHQGVRYAHTIDPRTCQPVDHGLRSVTVVHPQAMLADVLATVLLVLGPQHGVTFAKAHHLAALFVDGEPEQGLRVFPTQAFTQYVS